MKQENNSILMSSAIIFSSLLLLANPLLAHNGNPHNERKSEQGLKREEPSDPAKIEMEMKTETKIFTEIGSEEQLLFESSWESEHTTAIQNDQQPTSINLLPQPGEWIFLLLVLSPFGLFSLKRWSYTK